MRFSAVQENSYGVGLGQETLSTSADESMMAATGDVEPGTGDVAEESSMISNLPLLFANGYPTSLEKITLPELERFITFMVQCSLGHDTTEVISEPKWWPKEVKFSIPIVRPKKIYDSYMSNLKKLVFRCYTYHRSEYLLRFCSYLSQYPHEKLEYINNWDSTTSLYLKTTGKLLVTFRNENMNYDKKTDSPRKKLLPAKKTKENASSTKSLRRRSQRQAPSPAMVEPPTDDIYLCDTCDAELIGYHQMQEHEKLCYTVEPRPPTPIDIDGEPELSQDQFMDYFHMRPNKSDPSKTSNYNCSNSGRTNSSLAISDTALLRSSSRIRGSINLTRCPTIPFSSPAGISLGKKSKMMTEVVQQERLDRIERHLHAPVLTTSTKPKWFTKTYEFDRWSVTYKPSRDKTKPYVHQYNFANYTDKPMLDLRSQLLYLSCKPIYVEVELLTDEQLEELKCNPSIYKSPEPKVIISRARSPSVESVSTSEADAAEESNPIEVIDLEDDDDVVDDIVEQRTARVVLPVLPPPLAHLSGPIVSLPMLQKRPQAVVAPIRPVVNPPPPPVMRRTSPIKPKSLKRPRPASTVYMNTKHVGNAIPVVDLVSSDDEIADIEVSSSPYERIDENYDPLQAKQANLQNSVADMNLYVSPSRYCGGETRYYAADSMTTWLASQHTNGYLNHSSSAFVNDSP